MTLGDFSTILISNAIVPLKNAENLKQELKDF